MNDTTTNGWVYCPVCGDAYLYGTQHICRGSTPQYIQVSNRDAEILARLDKIIELLERLTK